MLQLLLSRYSRKLLAQLPPFPSMLRLKHSESTAVSPCSERPSQPSTGSENVQSYQWFNFIFSPQKTVDENVNGSGVISCDGVPPSFCFNKQLDSSTTADRYSDADFWKAGIPTLMTTCTSGAWLQSYFEQPEGNGDVTEMHDDFIENDSVGDENLSSKWLEDAAAASRMAKLNERHQFSNTVEVQIHSGCRGSRMAKSLRKKHLLSRFRRFATSCKCSSEATPSGLAFRCENADDVDAVPGIFRSSVVGEVSCWENLRESIGSSYFNSRVEKSGVFEPTKGNHVSQEPVKFISVPPSKPVERSTRFSPLDVRAVEASVDDLRTLTCNKDIKGLRSVLNVYHWPHSYLVEHFLPQLFDVFIENGADCDEIKQLIWDYASTSPCAFVRDSVALAFFRRIVCEEGIEAAIIYARQHRNLFLVRPPKEDRHSLTIRRLMKKLFESVLSKEGTTVEDARRLQNVLVECEYIEDASAFMTTSLQYLLEHKDFAHAITFWRSCMERYQLHDGAYLLFRHALTNNKSIARQIRQINEIITVCEPFEHPFAPIAELIVELVKYGSLDDAKSIFARLSIPGKYFKAPLYRMVGKRENLEIVEKIAALFTECVFAEKKAWHKKRATMELIRPGVKQTVAKTESGLAGHLLASYQRNRKTSVSRSRKSKKCSIDAKQLHDVVRCIQRVWFDLSLLASDTASLSRLHSWCTLNKVDVDSKIFKQCQEFFAKADAKNPFDCSATGQKSIVNPGRK